MLRIYNVELPSSTWVPAVRSAGGPTDNKGSQSKETVEKTTESGTSSPTSSSEGVGTVPEEMTFAEGSTIKRREMSDYLKAKHNKILQSPASKDDDDLVTEERGILEQLIEGRITVERKDSKPHTNTQPGLKPRELTRERGLVNGRLGRGARVLINTNIGELPGIIDKVEKREFIEVPGEAEMISMKHTYSVIISKYYEPEKYRKKLEGLYFGFGEIISSVESKYLRVRNFSSANEMKYIVENFKDANQLITLNSIQELETCFGDAKPKDQNQQPLDFNFKESTYVVLSPEGKDHWEIKEVIPRSQDEVSNELAGVSASPNMSPRLRKPPEGWPPGWTGHLEAASADNRLDNNNVVLEVLVI